MMMNLKPPSKGQMVNNIGPRQVRLTLGLNQSGMAGVMGVHRNTWVKWERGEREITAAPARLLETLLWLKSKNLLTKYIKKFS